jgi:hypothetical protein
MRLKLIAIADAVIPPCSVGVPDLLVFFAELRKFRRWQRRERIEKALTPMI